ncbi:MAG: molybdopterin oxidoreductase [Gammaproteobacteria bacterium]
MLETPRFIQGTFAFEGRGLETPVSFAPKLTYQVPPDKRAQFIYCRVGNPTLEFVYVVMERDGRPMRMIPCGAKAGIHVPLAIVDDILPDSVLELTVAAPEGLAAKLMIDVGLVEI